MEASTFSIKKQQLSKGFFTLGSGPEVALIMGSCRVCPYVNYFNDWNKANGNRFTIHSIDPFNWNWDSKDNRTDYAEALAKEERNQELLSMLKSVTIFIHEYYQNGGMFNTSKDGEKNIYQFGLNPKTDICIPSFNDRFVLVGDIVAFDSVIRKKVMADYNVTGKLTDQTLSEIDAISQRNLLKFFEVCELSSFPGFGKYFKNSYRQIRYWHNSNHVTKWFTITIMMLICERIGIKLTDEFVMNLKDSPDIYANIFTPLTEYDSFDWAEPIKQLKELL